MGQTLCFILACVLMLGMLSSFVFVVISMGSSMYSQEHDEYEVW